MIASDVCTCPDMPGPDTARPTDVMEISLLLPGWQVQALESAARDRGLTAGQMVRRLIRDYFTCLDGVGPDAAQRLDAASQW
jgi:hypothetical protein